MYYLEIRYHQFTAHKNHGSEKEFGSRNTFNKINLKNVK